MADVDMGQAFELLDDLTRRLHDLDGASPDVQAGDSNKARMSARAQTSNGLLYAAHLARMVEVEILNQYHTWKGVEDVPSVTYSIDR